LYLFVSFLFFACFALFFSSTIYSFPFHCLGRLKAFPVTFIFATSQFNSQDAFDRLCAITYRPFGTNHMPVIGALKAHSKASRALTAPITIPRRAG
jgi:hypothetical protein